MGALFGWHLAGSVFRIWCHLNHCFFPFTFWAPSPKWTPRQKSKKVLCTWYQYKIVWARSVDLRSGIGCCVTPAIQTKCIFNSWTLRILDAAITQFGTQANFVAGKAEKICSLKTAYYIAVFDNSFCWPLTKILLELPILSLLLLRQMIRINTIKIKSFYPAGEGEVVLKTRLWGPKREFGLGSVRAFKTEIVLPVSLCSTLNLRGFNVPFSVRIRARKCETQSNRIFGFFSETYVYVLTSIFTTKSGNSLGSIILHENSKNDWKLGPWERRVPGRCGEVCTSGRLLRRYSCWSSCCFPHI